jgi:hypothetical protein
MADSDGAVILQFPAKLGMGSVAPPKARKPVGETVPRAAGSGSGLACMRIAVVHLPNRRTKTYPAQVPKAQVSKEVLTCFEHDGSFVVGGYNLDSDREPRWVTYLDRHDQVSAEISGKPAIPMWSTVLRAGTERDRLYAMMVADWPGIARFERRTGLLLPIIRLDPVDLPHL